MPRPSDFPPDQQMAAPAELYTYPQANIDELKAARRVFESQSEGPIISRWDRPDSLQPVGSSLCLAKYIARNGRSMTGKFCIHIRNKLLVYRRRLVTDGYSCSQYTDQQQISAIEPRSLLFLVSA